MRFCINIKHSIYNIMFSKTCRHFVSIVDNVFIKTSKFVPKRYSSSTYKQQKLWGCATAAAVGLSVYFAFKNTIKCELIDTSIEGKTLIDSKDGTLYEEAITKGRDFLQRVKDEVGAPGLVIGVSIDGKIVWEEGLGYADVENRVPCSGDTVMRIASISKSITMAAVAKLWEQGKLDMDKPVQEYVPYFPAKTFDGKPVTLTCRHLVSHLGGIRHYNKNDNSKEKNSKNEEDKRTNKKEEEEFELKEYYIKERYKDIRSAVELFKDDPLVAKPGSRFFYSTHGWTLISAIVEAVSKEQFHVHIVKLFKNLQMYNTHLDVNDVLIYHRSRNYLKDKKGRLVNAPYVDNSYKWAGGGFLSTVGDLMQFGNAMLYSSQFNLLNHCEILLNNLNSETDDEKCNVDKQTVLKTSESKLLPGYLHPKTIEVLWSPSAEYFDRKYGMGWAVIPEKQECQFCAKQSFCTYHTGAAVGASSVLLILPKHVEHKKVYNFDQLSSPKGTVVVILMNLQNVNLTDVAQKIAQIFDKQC